MSLRTGGGREGGGAGAILMAYGAPATLEDVGAYFTHIRGGRPPSPERVEELKERYRSIGDVGGLLRITEAQARAVQERLDSDGGEPVRVFTGMRHSPPFISDVVAGIGRAGVDRLVGLVLAPHHSSLSVGRYQRILADAVKSLAPAPDLILADGYHDHPAFVAAVSEALAETLAGIDRAGDGPPWVIFTAHSLPSRILEEGEPYVEQIETTARLAARSAGVEGWEVAFQSASPTGEPWLGPDLIERIEEAGRRGRQQVVVAPIGFVSDHLEILYDVDVLARRAAEEAGVRLSRTPSMNTRPAFIGAIARIIREALERRSSA